MERPDVNALKQLIPFNEMTYDRLEKLSSSIDISHAPKGACILDVDSTEDFTLYLLEGTLNLRAKDGVESQIEYTSPKAKAPLARLRPSRYRITAASKIKYLRIDNDLLTASEEDSDFDEISSQIEVNEHHSDEIDNISDRLTYEVYSDLAKNKLTVCSLPETAQNISKMVMSAPGDVQKIARALQLDPALSLKICKTASQLDGKSYGNCSEALKVLGTQKTEQIVLSSAMRELFRTDSKLLLERRRQAWRESVQVGALCGSLSRRDDEFDTELATLIGMLHNVTELIVLDYARHIPELQTDANALEECIEANTGIRQAAFSGCILPQELIDAESHVGNWTYEHSGKANLTDILLVAHLSTLKILRPEKDLPEPSSIPAFEKLRLDTPTLEKGAQRIDEAISRLIKGYGL